MSRHMLLKAKNVNMFCLTFVAVVLQQPSLTICNCLLCSAVLTQVVIIIFDIMLEVRQSLMFNIFPRMSDFKINDQLI